MKPKDLKAVFSWEERRPVIQSGVFFVPQHYNDHKAFKFPGWEAIFGNTNPVMVEFCSGNGHWIIEKAKEFPDRNWVAVELQFERVRKIWSKSKNEGLENLFVVCGEAWTFAHHYLPQNSVAGSFINFPDPWPKARHEKHRLMKTLFISELARILEPEAEITFVTDDRNYLEQTLALFLKAHSFRAQQPDPYFATQSRDYGTSYFDALWRAKGKEIFCTQFAKQQRVTQ